MMRLFIAFPLTTEVENSLGELINSLKEQGGKVKWVAPRNIHITVRFLGDTDEKLVEPLKQLLDKIASQFSPAEITIDRLGAFPNLNRPRVLWAGLVENDAIDNLRKLTRQVELAVRKLRFEKEKKGFKPHLTLGRVRDAHGLDNLLEYMNAYQFTPMSMVVDRVCLIQSTLTPQGPIYTTLHEVMLGKQEMRFNG